MHFDLDGDGEEDAGCQEGARDMGKGHWRGGPHKPAGDAPHGAPEGLVITPASPGLQPAPEAVPRPGPTHPASSSQLP